MENKELKNTVPVELNDAQLESVSGGMDPDLALLMIQLEQDSKSTLVTDLNSILDSKQTERTSKDEYSSKNQTKY